MFDNRWIAAKSNAQKIKTPKFLESILLQRWLVVDAKERTLLGIRKCEATEGFPGYSVPELLALVLN